MEMISALLLKPQSRVTADRYEPSLRQQVAAHFRAKGLGVDARTAHARMTGFYRSSGHAWSLALV
jgi:hypothetical protein